MEGPERQVRHRSAPAVPLEGSRSSVTGARPRPRTRGILRGVLWVILLALCAVVAYSVYLLSIVAQISTNPYSLTGVAADPDGRTNMLILGTGDPDHAGAQLADTIMMVSLNSRLQRIAQISIPRDLQVAIPGHGNQKINSANVYGGTVLSKTVVESTTNQPISYVVTTDFSGLRSVVDALGGLDVTVKERLTDPDYPCDDDQYKSCGLDILAGSYHMDGSQVLAYTRCRKGTCGNDFGRAARQQEVISLIGERLLTPSVYLNPTKLQQLATVAKNSIHTDLSLLQLVELGWRWRAYSQAHPIQHLVLSTAPGGMLVGASGSSNLLPAAGDFSVIQKSIADIYIDGSITTP